MESSYCVLFNKADNISELINKINNEINNVLMLGLL